MPTAQTQVRPRGAWRWGCGFGLPASQLRILPPARRSGETSHSPPSGENLPRRNPDTNARSAPSLRCRRAGARSSPGGSPRPRRAQRTPGRRRLVRRSARNRAAPESRTKGRAGWVRRPAPSPGLQVPRLPPLPGTAALTAPAPPTCGGCRPRSCCGQSAAKRWPQLGPSTRALAPPIVKGPAVGSAYKASAGVHAARRLPISSRDTAGSPRAVQSAAEPGPAQVQRWLAGRSRVGAAYPARQARVPASCSPGAPPPLTAEPA